MASPALSKRLDKELTSLQRKTGSLNARDLLDIVNTVVESFADDENSGHLRVYSEIDELAEYIQAAREDISALCPSDITKEHLPTASDELDAIVEATEIATNSIFEAVEGIEDIIQNLPPETSEKITAHITSVYEACSFQDITGQRINKVVKTLKYIETRIEEIMGAFDTEKGNGVRAKPDAVEPCGQDYDRPDAHLLNGPQLDGDAISQDDIDALLGND